MPAKFPSSSTSNMASQQQQQGQQPANPRLILAKKLLEEAGATDILSGLLAFEQYMGQPQPSGPATPPLTPTGQPSDADEPASQLDVMPGDTPDPLREVIPSVGEYQGREELRSYYDAINAAARQTSQYGVGASTLAKFMGMEAARDTNTGRIVPNAHEIQSPNSSATGLFQFMGPTFDGTMERARQEEIWDLSGFDSSLQDPRLSASNSALAAGIHAVHNKQSLARSGISSPTDTDLYLMHLLGEGGGLEFQAQLKENPRQTFRDVFGAKRSDANGHLAYQDGDPKRPRTLRQFYDHITNELEMKNPFAFAAEAAEQEERQLREQQKQVETAQREQTEQLQALDKSDRPPGFMADLERGYDQWQGAGAGFAATFNDAIGRREVAQTYEQIALKNMREAADNPRQIEKIGDAFEHSGYGGYATYARQVIGEQGMNLGTAAAGALAGAVLVPMIPFLGIGALGGALIGAFAVSTVLNSGEIQNEAMLGFEGPEGYERYLQSKIAENPNLAQEVAMMNLGGASIAGALDVASIYFIASPKVGAFVSRFGVEKVARYLRAQGMEKRYVRWALKAALDQKFFPMLLRGFGLGVVVEGTTESIQELTNRNTARLMQNKDITIEDMGPSMMQAFIDGGLIGGLFGGAMRGTSHINARMQNRLATEGPIGLTRILDPRVDPEAAGIDVIAKAASRGSKIIETQEDLEQGLGNIVDEQEAAAGTEIVEEPSGMEPTEEPDAPDPEPVAEAGGVVPTILDVDAGLEAVLGRMKSLEEAGYSPAQVEEIIQDAPAAVRSAFRTLSQNLGVGTLSQGNFDPGTDARQALATALQQQLAVDEGVRRTMDSFAGNVDQSVQALEPLRQLDVELFDLEQDVLAGIPLTEEEATGSLTQQAPVTDATDPEIAENALTTSRLQRIEGAVRRFAFGEKLVPTELAEALNIPPAAIENYLEQQVAREDGLADVDAGSLFDGNTIYRRTEVEPDILPSFFRPGQQNLVDLPISTPTQTEQGIVDAATGQPVRTVYQIVPTDLLRSRLSRRPTETVVGMQLPNTRRIPLQATGNIFQKVPRKVLSKRNTLTRIDLKPSDKIFIDSQGVVRTAQDLPARRFKPLFEGTEGEIAAQIIRLQIEQEKRAIDAFPFVQPRQFGWGPGVPVRDGHVAVYFSVPRDELGLALKRGQKDIIAVKDPNQLNNTNTAVVAAIPEHEMTRVLEDVKQPLGRENLMRFDRIPASSMVGYMTPQNKAIPFEIQGTNPLFPAAKDAGIKVMTIEPATMRKFQPVVNQIFKNNNFQLQNMDKLRVMVVESITQKAEEGKVAHLRGAQVGNLILLATKYNPSAAELSESFYHEYWHFMSKHVNALNQTDRAVLARSVPRLNKLLSKVTGVELGDLNNLAAIGRHGTEEIHAQAFGMYATGSLRQGLGPIKGIYQKLINVLRRFKDGMLGRGFRTVEDIFTDVKEGEYKTWVDQDSYNESLIRAQDVRDAHHDWKNGKDGIDKSLVEDDTEFGYVQNALAIYHTLPGQAARHHNTAVLWDILTRKQEYNRELHNRWNKGWIEIERFGPQAIKEAGDFLALQRINQTPLRKDQDGRILVGNGRLRAKEQFSRVVNLMEKLFRDVLQVQRANILKEITKMGYNLNEFTPKQLLEQTTKTIATSETVLENAKDPETGKLKYSNSYITAVKNNLLQAQTATEYLDEVTTIDDIIASNIPYVPFMRFGSWFIPVYNKATDELVYMEGIEPDRVGKLPKKRINNRVEALAKKYPATEFRIGTLDGKTSIPATEGSIKKSLNKKFLSIELMASLLHSVDPVDRVNAVDAIKSKLESRTPLYHWKNARNIPGFSNDWMRVMPTYLSGASHYISNRAFQPEIQKFEADVENANMTPTARKFLRNTMEYMESPRGDFIKTRAINFFYALGLNPSTALLQLITVPINTPAYMMQWNRGLVPSQFGTTRAMKDGLSIVFRNSPIGNLSLSLETLAKSFDDTNLSNYRKKGLLKSDLEVKVIKELRDRGILQEILVSDSLAESVIERNPATSVESLIRKGVNITGAPIAMGEIASRLATALAVTRSHAGDIDTLTRAFEALSKSDKRIAIQLGERQVVEDGTVTWSGLEKAGLTPAAFLARQAIFDINGQFGKEGRGVLQRHYWGSIVFPFMTWPMSQLEHMARMFGRDKEGLKAGATLITSYMLLAGMYGIPGMDLGKFLWETFYKSLFKDEIDFKNWLRITLQEQGMHPWGATSITDGMLRSTFDMDVARRIGVPLFWQDVLMGLMEGDVREVSGVLGSMLDARKNFFTSMEAGEPASSAFMTQLAPVAFRNAYQGLVQYTGFDKERAGAFTSKGKSLATPDELTGGDVFMKTLGITPGLIAERREINSQRRIEKEGYQIGLRYYKNRIARKVAALNTMDPVTDADQINTLNAEVDDLMGQLVKFYEDREIALDMETLRRDINGISDRAMQLMYPDVTFPGQINRNVDDYIYRMHLDRSYRDDLEKRQREERR